MCGRDWSSDVCSSDLPMGFEARACSMRGQGVIVPLMVAPYIPTSNIESSLSQLNSHG